MHAKEVMRKIRALAVPFPLATAQSRLDQIAELATAKIDTSPVTFADMGLPSLNREEPASEKSGEVEVTPRRAARRARE